MCTGIVMAVVLTIVIIFPLLVVCTWAFADVWRYPNVIPQQFGLRFWHDTLARADVWNALLDQHPAVGHRHGCSRR